MQYDIWYTTVMNELIYIQFREYVGWILVDFLGLGMKSAPGICIYYFSSSVLK